MTALSAAELRARLPHPVIDSDGHTLEFMPAVREHLTEVGGRSMAAAYDEVLGVWKRMRGWSAAEKRAQGLFRMTWWGFPARQTDDQIGLCGAPIEDHHPGADTRWHYLPDGSAAGIPYRTLVVRDATNVLVAGRCFSATHDAHASVRSMAQCMAMGQAAGTAAAMAVAAGIDPRDVDSPALRDRLRADGAIVDLEAAVDVAPIAVPA